YAKNRCKKRFLEDDIRKVLEKCLCWRSGGVADVKCQEKEGFRKREEKEELLEEERVVRRREDC
ncbi:7827_t:CDS:2, partial [Cetraspora pellucida]